MDSGHFDISGDPVSMDDQSHTTMNVYAGYAQLAAAQQAPAAARESSNTFYSPSIPNLAPASRQHADARTVPMPPRIQGGSTGGSNNSTKFHPICIESKSGKVSAGLAEFDSTSSKSVISRKFAEACNIPVGPMPTGRHSKTITTSRGSFDPTHMALHFFMYDGRLGISPYQAKLTLAIMPDHWDGPDVILGRELTNNLCRYNPGFRNNLRKILGTGDGLNTGTRSISQQRRPAETGSASATVNPVHICSEPNMNGHSLLPDNTQLAPMPGSFGGSFDAYGLRHAPHYSTSPYGMNPVPFNQQPSVSNFPVNEPKSVDIRLYQTSQATTQDLGYLSHMDTALPGLPTDPAMAYSSQNQASTQVSSDDNHSEKTPRAQYADIKSQTCLENISPRHI